jgi:hypothetical protein
MKKAILPILLSLMLSSVFGGDIHSHHDASEKRFMADSKRLPDASYQASLREASPWQQFLNQHGDWWVQFNEGTGRPHRAFGTPIDLGISGSPAAMASYFVMNQLPGFVQPNMELEFISAPETKKYINVNFKQRHLGKEILWSRISVRLSKPDYKIVMFGVDLFDNIQVPMTPTLTPQQANAAAIADLTLPVTSIQASPDLKILPIPGYRSYDYRLVYELEARTLPQEGQSSAYYTLVDAHSGEVLYRKNRIVNFASSDIVVGATVYPTHPYNPTSIVNLPYLQVTVGGIDYNTDNNGFLNFPNTSPYNATFTLRGPWAQVYTGASGTTLQSFSATMNPGQNTVNFDTYSTDRHLSAYYHTNVVHDFMKAKLGTGFTGLDFPINVKVERTDGTCNAFYDGGLNFYTTAGGCYALSMVADVIYHEYGHGITNVYWSFNGLNFDNGAMGEGYSDIWGISITGDPVLGIGFSDTDPTSYVRNYDFNNGVNRKVYPQNIVGQVHADGEIIAGAWWSTGLLLGSLTTMSDLFAETHAGLANGPDGAEGQVYTDILIDALLADDNDANLSNGTPNAAAISQGFAQHGISLLSNASLNHTPVTTSSPNAAITLNANLSNLQFAWAFSAVKGAYRLNNSTTWTPFTMSTSGANNYTTTIPGQPAGTVIAYYIAIEDVNGTLSNVMPLGSNTSNPNIPYFIMVGFDKIFTDDFDVTSGSWQEGLASDGATTGIWEQNVPEQTDITGTVVQPDFQVTPGGAICYVTGGTSGGTAGANDVDGGATTLTSPVYDLTSYTNPTFEYYRWYTNDQGATPGTDYWQVYVSNNGSTYVPVENTNVSDHSWRRFVFRLNDYITPSSTVTVRFVAEDATPGSLIEALMDEFSLYDELSSTGINEPMALTSFSVWPNPADEYSRITVVSKENLEACELQVIDPSGRLVDTRQVNIVAGPQDFTLSTRSLSNGIYQLRILNRNGMVGSRKLSVMR